MLPRALSAVMLAASASAENYVVYQSQTHTNTPPARALSASVIQHAVSSSATFGRYVWMFGGLGSSLNALNDLWRLDMQTNIWAEQTAIGVAPTSGSCLEEDVRLPDSGHGAQRNPQQKP